MPKMRGFVSFNFVSPINKTLSIQGIVPAAVFAFIVPEGTAVVLFFTITASFAVLCTYVGFFVDMNLRKRGAWCFAVIYHNEPPFIFNSADFADVF